MKDSDIPPEVRQELRACADENGKISYYYLCDLWRRGYAAGQPPSIEERRRIYHKRHREKLRARRAEEHSAVSKNELRLNLDSATKALLECRRQVVALSAELNKRR
jgi:hypothetical protein